MARRGGLGQRGLDLLISGIPAAAESSASGNEPGQEEHASGEKHTKDAGAKGTKSASSKAASAKRGKSAGTKAANKSTSKKTASAKGTRNANTKAANKKETTSTGAKTAGIGETERKGKKGTESDSGVQKKEVTASSKRESGSEKKATGTAKNSANKSNNIAIANNNNASQQELPLSLIEPNREQPRKNFDEDSLQELADSIRTYGVLQPLVVQKREDYYEIIAGERRWRASKIAGLKQVPVVIKDYTPREIMEISLIENIQREDLNPIEEAAAYQRLMEEYGLRQDEVAERVSRSRAAVANAVRLLHLDRRVQEMVVREMLSTGHARALLSLTDPELQYKTAQRVFDEKLSVREVERLVKKLLAAPAEREKKPAVSDALSALYGSMEEQMKATLGTKVKIASKSPQKGKIEIEYYSSDELERIYQILRTPVQEGAV